MAKVVLECWFLYFEGSLLLGCRPSPGTASRLEAITIRLEAIATRLLLAWRPSQVGWMPSTCCRRRPCWPLSLFVAAEKGDNININCFVIFFYLFRCLMVSAYPGSFVTFFYLMGKLKIWLKLESSVWKYCLISSIISYPTGLYIYIIYVCFLHRMPRDAQWFHPRQH